MEKGGRQSKQLKGEKQEQNEKNGCDANDGS